MMEKEFQLIRMETHVLRVHIHCKGCARKVKRILKKIDGVYVVSIDADNHKVKVSGNVDSATLIKKLIKSGKHAELYSPTKNQNQKDEEFTSSMMPEANFGGAMLGNNTQSGSRECTTPDAGFEEERYHAYYSPFSMRNNMQQYEYDYDSNNMMNLQSSPFFSNYELYSPGMISNNMQQYQEFPAYDYFSPTPMMQYPYTNNMQQYYSSPHIQDVNASYFPLMYDDIFLSA